MGRRIRYGICFFLLGACCCVALPAVAVPVKEIRQAQTLMDQGAPGEALDMLKELLVDYPESPEVRFSVGCAWFMLGGKHMAEGNVEEAQKAYKAAKSAFDALLLRNDGVISREATFNRANCAAMEAMTYDPQRQYGEAMAALRRAVDAYENGLKEYPDHEGMQANLDHVRLQLKQLLQNTPPEEEQQEEQPPETPPPPVFSRFGSAATKLPDMEAAYEDDTARLIKRDVKEGKP